MENIIGDYLSLNYDVTQEKIKSKYPKFISNFIAKKRYKRLIKSATKIKKANNYRLNKNNLAELFSFVHSNYDFGKYKSIEKVIVSDTTGSVTGIIIKDNYRCDIIIHNKDDNDFDFNALFHDRENNERRYSVALTELSSSNLELDSYISILNQELLSIISDYIVDYISNFLRKEKI